MDNREDAYVFSFLTLGKLMCALTAYIIQMPNLKLAKDPNKSFNR